jgi:hypothetical protein
MNFGVTVTCFLLGYAIVAILEASRWVAKIRGRSLWLIGTTAVSWLTHSLYLVDQLWLSIPDYGQPLVLSSWFQWALLVAWGVATIYLILLVRRPDNAFGTFMLPLLLGFIGVALAVRNAPPFERNTTISTWRMLHAISLLVGTMIVTFGMAVGLMYLFQAYRLKHKYQPKRGFRLPSLEYLQSLNRMCLFVSFAMLAAGLVTGIILNINQKGTVAWIGGGTMFTFALALWSLAAVLIEVIAQESFGGRRTAYLTIANFLFLSFVLSFVFFSSHGQATDHDALEPPVILLPEAGAPTPDTAEGVHD